MKFKNFTQLVFYRMRYKLHALRVAVSKKYADWKVRGRERLTIMIIPHNEKQTVNFEISYKVISLFIFMIMVLMTVSAMNVLSHSGSIHELTQLNLSNKDFITQSAKMKQEVNSLHGNIDNYYNKITDLYLKLGGNPVKVSRGLGGSSELEPVKTDIPDETYQLKQDVHNMKIASELTQEILNMLKKRKAIIQHTPSIWPVSGYIIQPFGEAISPLTGTQDYSSGIKISAFPGSEVIATAPGKIISITRNPDNGYNVKIAHKYTWKTIYANLDRVNVKEEQEVGKNDVIGYVGKVKGSQIYHLHYEIHVGTEAINPVSFLNQIQK